MLSAVLNLCLFTLASAAVLLVVAVAPALDPTTKWIGVVTVVALAVTAVANVVLQVLARAEAARVASAAAQKVEEVKHTLEDKDILTNAKLEGLAKVADATHTLVNSAMCTQLKISAVALRRVADLTKHPDDVAAAELAEKGLVEQVDKQKIADRGSTK